MPSELSGRALVDRKITQYFSEYHGILRKLEKDKYLYIGTMEYLPAMKENRFSVLEEAKSVNIGNDMSVTDLDPELRSDLR